MVPRHASIENLSLQYVLYTNPRVIHQYPSLLLYSAVSNDAPWLSYPVYVYRDSYQEILYGQWNNKRLHGIPHREPPPPRSLPSPISLSNQENLTHVRPLQPADDDSPVQVHHPHRGTQP